MCYSVAFLEKKLSRLTLRYRHLQPPGNKPGAEQTTMRDELPFYYFVSGFSHPLLPFITNQCLQLFSWGLIPFWVKAEEQAATIRKGTLNAVSETVFEKPSYKHSIRTRRGLLPISGFFEWREFQNKKYPYFIKMASEELCSLACIYDTWTNPGTGEIITSFSILTTPADALMEVVHNRKKRMPLILNRENEQKWMEPNLKPDELAGLLTTPEKLPLQAYTVSRMLNYAGNQRNIPEAIAPVRYPELPPLPD
ncbi:MAG: SOS response-associated peptidase [Bacteroidales bacterium]|nr:SOS response-associated peptidase [Bacteroidales bacterium]